MATGRRAHALPDLEATQPTAFPDDTRVVEALERRRVLRPQSSLLSGEVSDELGATRVVLAHVVVVDRLFDQAPLADERVDGSGGGVGGAKERFAVDLAHDAPVGLDDGVGSDHLQVEDEPAGA